jgi:hypothetical protein
MAFKVKGWDYSDLLQLTKAATIAERKHVPVLIHVNELTSPGTFHIRFTERYKRYGSLSMGRGLIVLNKYDYG